MARGCSCLLSSMTPSATCTLSVQISKFMPVRLACTIVKMGSSRRPQASFLDRSQISTDHGCKKILPILDLPGSASESSACPSSSEHKVRQIILGKLRKSPSDGSSGRTRPGMVLCSLSLCRYVRATVIRAPTIVPRRFPTSETLHRVDDGAP